MVAPTTWSAPSSGGGAVAGAATVAYVGGYWISTASDASTGSYIRATTDPTGTWTTATGLPSTFVCSRDGFVGLGIQAVYDGSSVYAVGGFSTSTGNAQVAYTTTPSGSWSIVTISAPSGYRYIVSDFGHDGSLWWITAAKEDLSLLTTAPVTLTASSVTGTWTEYSSSSDIGATATDDYAAGAIAYNGLHYLSVLWLLSGSIGSANELLYSSSVIGGWTTLPHSLPSGYTINQLHTTYPSPIGQSVAGYFYVPIGKSTGGSVGTDEIAIASGATSTWSAMTKSDFAHTNTIPRRIVTNGSDFLAVGGTTSGEASYLTASSPIGTYTAISFGGYYPTHRLTDAAYHAGYFVVTNYQGKLAYCYAPPDSLGRTYLRQRQSPVRTPSRIRGVDTRLRQTPTITK